MTTAEQFYDEHFGAAWDSNKSLIIDCLEAYAEIALAVERERSRKLLEAGRKLVDAFQCHPALSRGPAVLAAEAAIAEAEKVVNEKTS